MGIKRERGSQWVEMGGRGRVRGEELAKIGVAFRWWISKALISMIVR
jgi:hypothetical protein